MRIDSLTVQNFRAIRSVELCNLGDSVVIAGPNGCGKSCIFDAIRLLKSVYGGYQANEWQNFFGEFQIDIHGRAGAVLSLFQDRSRPVNISAHIQLAAEEKEFLDQQLEPLLRAQVWRDILPDASGWRHFGATPLASQMRAHQPEVDSRVAKALPEVRAELMADYHAASLTIQPDSTISTSKSLVLELLFSNYEPDHLGIIDYHGANRHYGREQIGGINLNIESGDERLRNHALYNYSNKYANLKAEMAAGFIRQLLAKEANQNHQRDETLTETLTELFTTFFPGKEFLGPQPTSDGKLLFPVRTQSGSIHDIDELSSGEKEVLYGYLRLRNASPRHSVLLIDEPELHLNPRLVSGLASFYHRHLGRTLGIQLWLVSHSDTLIREAVAQPEFSVFHMQPPIGSESINQASPVVAHSDLSKVVYDLVGDMAAYRPGAKIVIFEGGGDSHFDLRMTSILFPTFAAAVNAISGGNKRRVADLYEVLEQARIEGHLSARFYAITDSDGEPFAVTQASNKRQWDVYHIENYLLEPRFILRVLSDLNFNREGVATETEVLQALQDCAIETIPSLVAHKLKTLADGEFKRCLNFQFDPKRVDIAIAMSEAISRSYEKMTQAVRSELAQESVKDRAKTFEEEARQELEENKWRSTFRGRDVLRRFVGKYGNGMPYEAFRDLVLARMRDVEWQPAGMKKILDEILADSWDRP